LDAVSSIDGVVDVDLQRQRIIVALTRGHWSQVKSRIDVLPLQEREQPQWQYWKGRALQQLRQNNQAKTILAQVSQDRTYYAFLAANHGGYAYYLVNRPLQIEPALLQEIAQRQATRRAQELRNIGRIVDARLEWRWLTKNLDVSGLQAAANLANNWRWHDQAIFTLARSNFWDDLDLRFPLEHLNLVEQFAKNNQLPTAWVLAIIRQESAFAADAASPVGALGLMQLMPATAHQVAQKLGKPPPKNAMALSLPTTNIELGSSYLREMLQRFDNNIILATAAYNAGPTRVNRWLPKKTMNAEIWVEKIPFRETRIYVQRVMTYMIIYEQRLGLKPGAIVQHMRPIRSSKAIRQAVAAK
jgi:soluble lytic murein transglycosylase